MSSALTVGAVVALSVALTATPATAATSQASSSSPTTLTIAVPMTYTSGGPATTSSSSGIHSLATPITGNCGTAFVNVSKVGDDEVHIDYGFEKLDIHAIWINAHATPTNTDTGKVIEPLGYVGAVAFVTSWEQQGNKVTGAGVIDVIANIDAESALATCKSSPNLSDSVYVY